MRCHALVVTACLGLAAGCQAVWPVDDYASGRTSTGSGGSIGTAGSGGSGGIDASAGAAGGSGGSGAAAGTSGSGGIDGSVEAAGGSSGSAGSGGSGGIDGSVEAADAPGCTDVKSDSANCGACGHSCLGAACTNGLCPVDTVVQEDNVRCTATTTLYVRWMGASTPPSEMPKDGGSITQIKYTGTSPSACTFAGDYVYDGWTNGVVAQYNWTLLAFSSYLSDLQEEAAGRIAGDGATALWSLPSTGIVRYCTGYCSSNSHVVASNLTTPRGVFMDSKYFYWTEEGTGLNPGRVSRVPRDLDAGPVEVIASNQAGATDVAADATGIYWINLDGTVARRAAGATSVQVLYRGVPGPARLALDSSFVYWTNSVDGSVWRVPKAGGTALKLAEHQGNAESISVDGTYVYWAVDSVGGGVMRVAK